ncbi:MULTISPECIES: hypothetical protein [unclassified Streptomyces]|uniref:hypothetical protein n=1 Tax=unclassified Streptomyces TaxID=2593676 RepID=UPI00336AA597
MGDLCCLMRTGQLDGLLREPQVVQSLVCRVIRGRKTEFSAIQYQLDALRGSQESRDGLFALSALYIFALLTVTLHLDARRQVLPYERPRGPEKDTDQGENRASSNSIHGIQPGRWDAVPRPGS